MKVELKQTLTLTVDSEDYTSCKSNRGTDCPACPFRAKPRSDVQNILAANNKKCFEAFEELFGEECSKLRIIHK